MKKLLRRIGRSMATVGLMALGLTCAAAVAQAAIVISSANIGGVPTSGTTFVNFDNLPVGGAPGVSGGISVSFAPSAQVVTGSSSGLYAAPYLSNSNGVPFGDNTVSGQDTTKYLTTGSTGDGGNDSVTMVFPGLQAYFGLLWGSVDPIPNSWNVLTFYNGNTVVDTITGGDLMAFIGTNPNGNQGLNGTYYVNMISTDSSTHFNKIVATSTQYAFEFDNVAYNESAESIPEVPEPASLAIWGLGALGLAVGAYRRRKLFS